MNYRIEENKKFNSKEIYFEGKPDENTRNALKALKFRWNPKKLCWYGFAEMEQLAFIGASNTIIKAEKTAKQVETSHSFKVGDILASQWGYEQTNITLYIVTALNGRTMITVQECYLESDEVEAHSFMSEDISYKLPKDGGKVEIVGDPIKRKVQNWHKDKTAENDHIEISSYENAYHYEGKKLYRSWYA